MNSEATTAPQATAADALTAEFMSRSELRTLLDISERQERDWHTRRIGPPRVQIGHLVLYRREAVLSWLRSQEKKAPASTPRPRRRSVARAAR